jgi:hypothetical protein
MGRKLESGAVGAPFLPSAIVQTQQQRKGCARAPVQPFCPKLLTRQGFASRKAELALTEM